MTYNALLMDLDNTLYPYQPCHEAGKQAAYEQAKEQGYNIDRKTFDQLYQKGRQAVKNDLDGTPASHERHIYFKKALEIQEGTTKPQDSFILAETYWKSYINSIELFAGVKKTLEQIKDAEIKIGITTNLTTRIQLKKIQELGLGNYIDVLVTSEEIGRDKPATAMFAVPLAKLGVPPQEAVMIGDSIKADIEGGNGIGMSTVLFNNQKEPNNQLDEPDHRIDSFNTVQDIVTGERK